jgi:type I restriction enzyme, S subunit
MLKRIKIGELIREKKAHSQTGPFGTQLKASEYVEYGIPVINVRNIGMGDIRSGNLEYLNDSKALELKSHRLKKDDIVFGRKGAVERHSFITENEDGWIQGSDCIRLRILTDEFNPNFISYFFRTQAHQQWMINLGSFGATMGSLNQEIISKIEIPNIPRSKQDEITSILSAYDDLIENDNQRIKLLKDMAEEIYKEWFVRMRFPGYQNCKFFDKDINEVPHGTPDALPERWEEVKLANYVGFEKGVEPGSDNYETVKIDENYIPFLRVGDLGDRNGGIYIEKELSKGKLVTKNEILITLDGSVGKVTLGMEGCYSSGIRKITFKSDVIKRSFAYQTLLSSNIQGTIQAHAAGTTILHASSSIKYMKIYLPSLALLNQYEDISDPILNEILILGDKIKVLQETRDLLLPRLISGKLDVSEVEINESENLSMAAEPVGQYNT